MFHSLQPSKLTKKPTHSTNYNNNKSNNNKKQVTSVSITGEQITLFYEYREGEEAHVWKVSINTMQVPHLNLLALRSPPMVDWGCKHSQSINQPRPPNSIKKKCLFWKWQSKLFRNFETSIRSQ